MSKKIAFKSFYHVERIAPDMTFLFTEKECELLRGSPYYLLAPLLQKPLYSVSEIMDQLEGKGLIESFYYALNRLEQLGHIEEYDSSQSKEVVAYYNALGVPLTTALTQLYTTKVFVQAIGDVDATLFIGAIQALGIRTTPSPAEADLSVFLAEDYLREELEDFNKESLLSGRPWLLIKPKGHEIWIGPLFQPQKTGCWKCLSFRLRRNRFEQAYIANKNPQNAQVALSIASLPSTSAFAYHFAALELLKLILRKENALLYGKVVSFETTTGKMEEHTLTKRPQCPCCGNPLAGVDEWKKPILLTSIKKIEYQDGGPRLVLPQETLNKQNFHVSPITGIVSFLQPCGPDTFSSFKAYVAGHNFAISNEFKGVFRSNLRGNSGGKGRSALQAKASALCEAIERYSGIFEGNEIRIKASYKELGEDAIHPQTYLLYSQRQLERRSETNPLAHSFHKIPEPFSEERIIEWTPVWSMTHQKQKLLPTAYCYYAYPSYSESDFCVADSNGCASGNFLEEAILHGLLELIERDSVALWWYNRVQRPRVHLESFQDPYFQSFISDYEKMGRTVWVLDLTSDLNIPVFIALSKRMHNHSEEIIFGCGCNLNPSIAISRALTEMNQFLCLLPSKNTQNPTYGNTQDAIDYQVMYNWLHEQTTDTQPYLIGTTPVKSFADYPSLSHEDLCDDILFCQKIIEDAGMELLVLNQTRPDIELKVVRIVVPGLRHFWSRFASGRLYDIPVKLGWLKEPRKEEELNPIPIFI